MRLKLRRRRQPTAAQGFVSDDEAVTFWTAPQDRDCWAEIQISAGDFSGPPTVGDDLWFRSRSWLRPVVGTCIEAYETDSGGAYIHFDITGDDLAYLREHICEGW